MCTWWTDNRKKVQRQVNKTFRRIKKIITNDNLWRGRFAVCQKTTEWINLCGTREYLLFVTYYFIDKKTGWTSRLYKEGDFSLERNLPIQMTNFVDTALTRF